MRELLTIVKSLLRMTFLIKAVVLVMPNWHTESLEYPLDYNQKHIQKDWKLILNFG